MCEKSLGIGITYYNDGRLLTRAIEGLFNGSNTPDEVVVYDDASEQRASDFIPPSFPVRIIRAEINQGPGYGRNFMLHESKSDFLHFHDADDEIHPNWCERVRSAIHEKDPDMIITGMQFKSEAKEFIGGFLNALPSYPETSDLTLMAVRWGLATQEVTFRRILGITAGGIRLREDLPICQDSEFHARLAQYCSKYHFIHEPIAIRNVRSQSLSMYDGNMRIEHVLDHFKMATLLVEALPKKYHQDLAEAVIGLASGAAKRGEFTVAKQGFELAHLLGTPTYRDMRPGYRVMAKLLGPLQSEYLMAIYRQAIPFSFRQKIRDLL